MVFSSHLFLFYFLPLALLIYYVLPRRGKHLGLTLLSYLFYGWANPLFVVLMLVSTLIDYLCGLALVGDQEELEEGGERTARQKAALTVSLCSNLALLGFFKYFNLAAESFDALAAAIGLPQLQLDLAFRIILPLGISFYTFQSMSYAIDVYRGHARVMRNFIDFACFVSMFPQLVAGPIIRFSEVADQLRERTHTLEKFARGVSFVALGLGKKILIANPCGKIADVAFSAGSIGFVDSWYGACGYAFQIYFDFSAYSDMAIGLGLMLGFMFAKNFDSPYCAHSITEFWQRWHISLSTWLRDYLYIPLGGNQRGPRRTYFNLIVVMLLGGLWHGAAWNFVIWGGLHGVLLAAERWRGKAALYNWAPRPVQVAFTFALLLFTWVFFRSSDLPSALTYCRSMLGLITPLENAQLLSGLLYKPYYAGTFALAAAVVWGCPQTWDWTRRITWPRAAWCAAVFIASILVLTMQAYNPFIYFIF